MPLYHLYHWSFANMPSQVPGRDLPEAVAPVSPAPAPPKRGRGAHAKRCCRFVGKKAIHTVKASASLEQEAQMRCEIGKREGGGVACLGEAAIVSSSLPSQETERTARK